jgi:hypothetical protein
LVQYLPFFVFYFGMMIMVICPRPRLRFMWSRFIGRYF